MEDRAQTIAARPDSAEEQLDGIPTATHGEGKLSARVMGSLPRLREIAIQAALLSPIIVSLDGWSSGTRGC